MSAPSRWSISNPVCPSTTRRAGQPIAAPAVLDVNLDVHKDGLS